MKEAKEEEEKRKKRSSNSGSSRRRRRRRGEAGAVISYENNIYTIKTVKRTKWEGSTYQVRLQNTLVETLNRTA